MVQLLNALTEATQGPCLGNQLVLSHSQFFEAVSGLWNAVLKAWSHRDDFSGDYGTWRSLKHVAKDEVVLRRCTVAPPISHVALTQCFALSLCCTCSMPLLIELLCRQRSGR
jgi:hypothetical protein